MVLPGLLPVSNAALIGKGKRLKMSAKGRDKKKVRFIRIEDIAYLYFH